MNERLSDCELAIIEALAEHGGWMDAETLNWQTADASRQYDHATAGRGVGCVRVHIFGIREKLGDGAIIGMYGRGYTLGAPGVRVYRAHLAAQAAWAAV